MLKVWLCLIILKAILLIQPPTHSTLINQGKNQNLAFLGRHFQKFSLMIPFFSKDGCGDGRETQREPEVLQPSQRSRGGTLQAVFNGSQLHRTVTKSKKCCFHLSFDSFTRLILLPKLLMCFMFLQSANSGVLDPNLRQYAFQQEPFVLTNTVKVSIGSTDSRQVDRKSVV